MGRAEDPEATRGSGDAGTRRIEEDQLMDEDEALSRLEIMDVLARYAHAVDRQDFELARTCYHPDAHDNHGRYEGDLDGLIAFFHQIGDKLAVTVHMLGQHLFSFEHCDLAHVETYSIFYQRLREVEMTGAVMGAVRYLDRFERRHGEWRIADRTVVLDWEQAGNELPHKPIGATWTKGALGDDDPAAHLTRSLHARYVRTSDV